MKRAVWVTSTGSGRLYLRMMAKINNSMDRIRAHDEKGK